MEVTVESRAHRKLRKLSQYRSLISEAQEFPYDSLKPSFQAGEKAIGVYENIPGSVRDSLLFTNKGLYINEGTSWSFIVYEDMVGANLEGEEKALNVKRIEIGLRSGRQVSIPVTGHGDFPGTRDAFSVCMFLEGVIGDIKRRQSKETD